jgi:hypothetical protein
MGQLNTSQGMRPQSVESTGSGMLASAQEMLQLRPYWEQEYTSGQTTLQFDQWLRKYKEQYQNAPKLLPPQGPGY